MRGFPKIMCAKCNMLVHRFEWSLTPALNEFEIRVECHGEREKCYLPRDFDESAIIEAWAFKPSLPALEQKLLT
jgi:hypothetical protein